MLVLDKWTGNHDGRQAVFFRDRGQRKYRTAFIDHGYCFNAHEWKFSDLALHGVYYRNHFYRDVTSWESFEPTLSRAERMTWFDLWHCAGEIPRAWYDGDTHGLRCLVEALYERRSTIRALIEDFRQSPRNLFPNWGRVNSRLQTKHDATEQAPATTSAPVVQPLLAACHA